MDNKEQRDEAEGELLDLIRRNDAQNFLVTIICMEHRWRVEVIDHDAKQTEPRSDRSIGDGDSFTEAWLRQNRLGRRAKSNPLASHARTA